MGVVKKILLKSISFLLKQLFSCVNNDMLTFVQGVNYGIITQRMKGNKNI